MLCGFLEKVEKKCQVLFFGGDFDVYPRTLSDEIPKEFQVGGNKSFLKNMRQTDEFGRSTPYHFSKICRFNEEYVVY